MRLCAETLWPTAAIRSVLLVLLSFASGIAVGRRDADQAQTWPAVAVLPLAPVATAVLPVAGAAPPTIAAATTIEAILAHDERAEVRDLRPGERIVLWKPQAPEDVIWGGGGRASLFIEDGAGWRHVGDVDSKQDLSTVSIATVDPSGVAVLVESYQGNGAPPEHVYALALAGGRIVTADSGDVARVEFDGDAATPELRVWRRIDGINTYPGQALHVARWQVRRTEGGLAATEESLTPWVDVIAAFCTGAHPELADAEVLAQVDRCNSSGETRLRWTPGRAVVAELGLDMRCGGEDDIVHDVEHVDDAELVLKHRPEGWRIISVRGCDE